MSYILDALKKAERERGLAEVPTLETMHEHPAKLRVRLWMIPGLFMIGGIVALWLILPSLRSGNTPSTPNPDVSVSMGNQSDSVRFQNVPPEAVTPQDPRAGDVLAAPADFSPVMPAMESRRDVSREQRFNPSNAPSVIPETARTPQDRLRQEAIERVPSVPSVDPSVQSLSGGGDVNPIPLADAIAGMTMSIHVFSEDKAERMVFINGRKYLEGDYVDKVYLLESITPEGAVLRYGTKRAVLRPGSR